MATTYAKVQDITGSSLATTSTEVLTPGSATTVGNLGIVYVYTAGSTTVSSVTDSGSNTWVKFTSEAAFSGLGVLTYFHCMNMPASATTITLHFGGTLSQTTVYGFREYSNSSGIWSTGPTKKANASGPSAPATGATATSTNAAVMLDVAIQGSTLGSANTVGTGYGNFLDTNTTAADLSIMDKTTSATGTQSATFGTSASLWEAIIVTYSGGVVLDADVTGTGNGVNSITTAALTTVGTNELLLAFDYESQNGSNISSITTTGVTTWTTTGLSASPNGLAANGFAEIWRVFAAAVVTAQTTTVNFSGSNFPQANAIVAAFIGAATTGTNGSGAIGATATATGSSTAPSVTLTTTTAKSLVVGVIAHADNNTLTAGTAQILVEVKNAGTFATTDFLRQNDVTTVAGTNVTINGTITSNPWAAAALEILPFGSGATTTIYPSQYKRQGLDYQPQNSKPKLLEY